MKKNLPLSILWSNLPLKVFSLIIGYTFWLILSSSYTTELSVPVPLCFYDTPENKHINAPDTIDITLVGNRTDLYHLDRNQLAVHIDSRTLALGKQLIQFRQENLLLPESITIAHYCPSNIIVDVTLLT